MLRIWEYEENRWGFYYEPDSKKLIDALHKADDFRELGNNELAEDIYKEIIKEFPDCIAAHNSLGVIYYEEGKFQLAKENWLKGYKIGIKTIPKNFIVGQDLLEWRDAKNRDFLLCISNLGFYFLRRCNLAKAMELFEFRISLDPRGRQGVIDLLIECYLKIGNYKGVIELCDRYEDYESTVVLYGKPYALLKLGYKDTATFLLREAMQLKPIVLKELKKKKHRKPKLTKSIDSFDFEKEEAYNYWQSNSILWEDPEIKKWLNKYSKYKNGL
jgi:tetratricopeptide (TPR) repeat protein